MTCVPPVTLEPDVGARLLEHRRRLAGDGRLVDVGDALDHLAVAGDDVVGLDQHDVALAQLRRADDLGSSRRAASSFGRASRLRVRAQRVGLRLAARLGHRLGEVGEEHGEPEPERDLAGEAAAPPGRAAEQRRAGTRAW